MFTWQAFHLSFTSENQGKTKAKESIWPRTLQVYMVHVWHTIQKGLQSQVFRVFHAPNSVFITWLHAFKLGKTFARWLPYSLGKGCQFFAGVPAKQPTADISKTLFTCPIGCTTHPGLLFLLSKQKVLAFSPALKNSRKCQ